jgi:hypothetical protein
MTVSELRTILAKIQNLCASSGAQTAAKDLQTFSDILKPYSNLDIDKACAEIKHCLNQVAAIPATRSKTTKAPTRKTSAPDENAIQRHLTELRDAGTDQKDFDLAFQQLTSSKKLKLPDLAEIAHLFSGRVTTYKSKAAAHADIEGAFVRRARFENKID